MSAVQLQNIRKVFSSQIVLNDINLEIQKGEFLVLVGPSGCGKSTLLRLIAGLEEQTSGSVRIDHQIVDGLEPMKRGVSMVFQSYALYPHLNVAQNLGFGLKLSGASKEEIEKRVKSVAETLQIQSLLERKPKELSGGQRQRVALGRALVRNTSLILFDEPLSNLDAHLRSQMRYEIKRLHQLTGSTMIYVTHDQTEATTLGDRIAILNQGKLVQVDKAQKVYEEPKNIFVASFIGSPEMNLVPGGLLGMNQEIVCGIRPEDFKLAQGKGSFQAQFEVQEYMGAQYLIHANLSKQGEGFAIRILSPEPCHIQSGGKISFDINLTKMVRFDRKTGERLY